MHHTARCCHCRRCRCQMFAVRRRPYMAALLRLLLLQQQRPRQLHGHASLHVRLQVPWPTAPLQPLLPLSSPLRARSRCKRDGLLPHHACEQQWRQVHKVGEQHGRMHAVCLYCLHSASVTGAAGNSRCSHVCASLCTVWQPVCMADRQCTTAVRGDHAAPCAAPLGYVRGSRLSRSFWAAFNACSMWWLGLGSRHLLCQLGQL